MKKLMTLIVAIALATPALAQLSQHRTNKRDRFDHSELEQYYGFRIGLNIASLASDDPKVDSDSRSGVAIGAVYGFQLATSMPLWLEGGLYYTEKGGKLRYQGDKVTTRLSYLQLPIVVKYSIDAYDKLTVQPYAGGFLSLGIAGKVKNYGVRESNSSFDTFNRFDAGLRLGCGAEYQMFYAELGYDLGLADISKDEFDSTHTRNFFINVGVNF